MKIPRYITGRSNIAELSSEQVMSPAMAAQTALAKGALFASAATSISKTAQIIAEVKAEEEMSDAIIDLEKGLVKLDYELANKPNELDDQGNIIFDAEEMLSDELERRNELAGNIRKNLKSGMAKRAYDKYVADSSQRRNEQYASVAIKRNAHILGAQALNKSAQLRMEGEWELAEQRILDALKRGVLSQPQADAERTAIASDRTQARIRGVTESDDVTGKDLYAALDAIDEGEWKDGTKVILTEAQKYAAATKINKRLNELDYTAFSVLEKAREDKYLELITPALTTLTTGDLNQMRGELGKDRFDQLTRLVIGRSTSDASRVSDPDAMREHWNKVMMVTGGYGMEGMPWNETRESVIEGIRFDNRITGEDRVKLIGRIEATMTAMESNNAWRDLLNIEKTKITGKASDDIFGLTPVNKDHLIEYERLEQAFFEAGRNAGPKFDPQKWIKDYAPAYHARVQKSILKEYGIYEIPMKDGQPDMVEISKLMFIYNAQQGRLRENNPELGTWDAELVKREAEEKLRQFRSLVGAG